MLILQDILSQEIVQRLGWTLLHFTWQAAAVALIMAILLRVLRKSTANVRYIFACLALALIVLLPVITIKLVPVSQPLTAAHFTPAPVTTVLPTVEMPAPETLVIAKPSQPESVNMLPAIPFKQRAVDTLEPTLPYIVSGWLIGVFGLSIWHLGGWTQLQRLKRRMVKHVDSTLLNKLKVLTQKLKVKQTVQLMESALIQIPTVVGWLRPVILLPASALTGLSSEQLEAIIAHELAHIKRLDYLINILQTVVEILGFYHPAVWWVSHKIRAERENCCDDIAVSISGDRVSYAGALASMEEIRAASGKLAVAATGGNLFRRICRLLSKDSTDNTALSWVPAATAILLIIALAIPTTLALTNKPDSMLTEIKTEVPVEDDILIETVKAEESPAENIPPVPLIATSPAPSDKDKAHVKVNFLVVEVPQDSKIDAETLAEAKNILGNKISLRNTKVNIILRQAAKATAAAKDESTENKRITARQFNTLVKMLDSKGYIKIIMNPMIETLNGKTAEISSASSLEKFSLEITPSVLADGNIILEVEANIRTQDIPVFEESAPVSLRQLSSKVCASPGESMIIGGLIENPPAPGDIANNTVKQAKEVLFILTPTIVNTDNNSEQKAESTHKLKLLGLAVAMYADDHDEILPHTLKEVKPYIRDEDVFDWILDNIEYFDKGKTAQRNAAYIPIAYDKSLLEKADGTNILSLDFSVRFVDSKEFEKLDIKRAEILIEAWFLAVNKDFIENINHNADSPDEAKELFKLKPELLAAMDGHNTMSFIPSDRDVNLFLKAVRAHKDSKVLAAPHIKCLENKTADIKVMSNETYYIVGYTEPNNPSEKPQPKLEKVEEGIELSLKPNLTPNKKIVMQSEFKINQVSGFKEKMYKGKYPCKLPTIQRNTQRLTYKVQNGGTFLFGGHKIEDPDPQDGQTEQKDLLVLITAHIIDYSEQDKPAKTENLIVAEPPTTTTNLITQLSIAKGRTERPKDNEPQKTEPATDAKLGEVPTISDDYPLSMIENKDQVVQKFFKLKNYSPSLMGQIILPLVGEYGHISADERTNSLLVIDTVKSLMRIEKIIAQFDVSVAEQTVQKSFKLKYRSPSQMAQILNPLLTKTGHASAEESSGILLVIDTPENLKRIEKIIAAFDVLQAERTIQKFFRLKYYSPSKMGQILIPLITKTGHISTDENTGNLLVIDTVENLKRIELIITEYDVPQADETVTEIFEIRNGDPVEIVELLKKLINGRLDTASVIKPDTASIIESSNGPIVLIPEPRRKWIIAKASHENIKQIGQWIEKLDTNKSTIGLDPIDAAVFEQLEAIVDLSELAPGMSFGEVVEILENAVQPPLQIQPIWKDLLDNAEVEQATPAGMDPLPHIKLRKALEILLTSVSSTGLPKLTYIVDEGVILIGTVGMLPPKMAHRVYDISDPNELRKTTEHQQQPSQIRPKIPKLSVESEESMTPLEQVQKQLDELIKQQQALKVTEPNLPPAPKVKLISNTFIDETILNALQYIAAAADVTIIPDETVTGLVSCTLKDVTVEKALDIILAGTPYLWKKTPHYYLVASRVELSKMVQRVYDISDLVFEPANYGQIGRKLGMRGMKMGGMGGMISNQGNDIRAQSLVQLIQETIKPDSWDGLSDTGEGTIMAYPIQSPRKLAVMQTHEVHQEIDKLLNARRESLENQVSISVETVFLSVSEDYLKDVGLDANTANFSDGWTRHLAAKYPAGPNGQPYGLIIDDLHVRFLLRAVQAHHDSKAIVAPRVLTREGTTASLAIGTKESYVKGYDEPQDPSGKPQQKLDKVELGTRIWLTPELTPDNRNIDLDFKLEIRQLKDIIEGKYEGKYPYQKPIVDVISAKMPCTIPDGKTMLIGGLKIIEHVTKKPRTSGLKDLPLIGAAFRSKDKIKDQKMLLILVKPITNPQQKATKILPGQKDSEEHIKRLAEQLDKKINPPGIPRQ